MQERENALQNWLCSVIETPQFSLQSLHGDASFRRYFRLILDNKQYMLMDAPPDKENLHVFLKIAHLLAENQIRTPIVYAADEQQGFAMLEDFGDSLLLEIMNAENVQNWYRLAIDIIIQLQKCATVNLPPFDKAHMLGELNLFVEWFLKAYLKLPLQTTEEQMIADSFAWIVAQIEHQPQVLIHRDFHSRNLMIIDDQKNIGVIDFQDAMKGPITYDLVSLLKDCYIQWSQETVFELLNYFHQQSPLVRGWSINDLQRAFDVCGLQRHLKVLGVFSRLYLRDNKAGYLKDLPLTLHYVRAALEGVSELAEFYQFIDTRIQLPCIAQ